MSIVAVRIPQIGEGLQEARLVAVLKKPGDSVKRDEPIYQMETDKAVMDVESPYEGVLTEWLAEVDTVLPIGGEVARMEVGEGVSEMEVHGSASSSIQTEEAMAVTSGGPAAARNANIPPRTRAYAKEKGIPDAELGAIPAATGKLMPSDIDAYLNGSTKVAVRTVDSVGGAFKEEPLNQKQRVLSSRLVRGSQLVVPGTITVVTAWEPVEALRHEYKASGSDFQPSAFTMFAFAVARALKDHPHFRSTLRGEETLRTYEHASLGIAVARPGDELVLAVVEEADVLDWKDFASRMRERVHEAREGKDQANEAVTISLTNMQAFGLRDAVPVVVPPSVGTIFLGEPFRALDEKSTELKFRTVVNIVLTFDHRLMNGVGAANFINAVKAHVEGIADLAKLS
jgi:pyruvate dehydrogenase E2 component (dihydrolipoamide acetyltransferase)